MSLSMLRFEGLHRAGYQGVVEMADGEALHALATHL
jgi:hypothetical protein